MLSAQQGGPGASMWRANSEEAEAACSPLKSIHFPRNGHFTWPVAHLVGELSRAPKGFRFNS